MKKSTKGPTAKKGTVLGYQLFGPQEAPDPEGHLTDEQKTWPVSDEADPEPGVVPVPPVIQSRGPNPRIPPAV
jgi:hypothetical protein